MTASVFAIIYVYDVADPWTQQIMRQVHFGDTLADSSGEVVAWGDNSQGQLDVPAGAYTRIAAGERHSLATRSDGTLEGWGDNSAGQLAAPAGTFDSVAAGHGHSLATRSDGTLAGWGRDDFGQATVPGGTFLDVDARGLWSLALRTDGTLAGWGRDLVGEISAMPGGEFTAASAGVYHGIALDSSGEIHAWGDNNHGSVTNIPAGTFTHVDAGGYHNLAIRDDGTLAGWGMNNLGQATVPGGTFTAIAGGDQFSVAIRSDGSLAAWGDNAAGQTIVPAGTFVDVAAGVDHALALLARTDYDDDLLIYGTGLTANLNRSITVADDMAVETTTNFYNNPTATVGGDLILRSGAAFTGAGTINAGAMQVFGSATISSGQIFNIGSGGVNIPSSGVLEIASGSLSAGTLGVSSGGSFTKTSGTLSVNELIIHGEADITGSLNVQNLQVWYGSLSVSGVTSVSGGITIAGPPSAVSLGGLELQYGLADVQGTLNVSGDIEIGSGSCCAELNIYDFGLLNQTGSTTLTLDGVSGSAALYSSGTVTSGTGGINVVSGAYFQSNGTLNVNGPLVVDQASVHVPGTLNVSGGATIAVQNGGTFSANNVALAAGNDMTVTGTGTTAVSATSLAVGTSAGDVTLTLSNDALLNYTSLLRVTPTGTTGSGTHRVDVLSGADVTNLGNVELGNNTAGTFDAQINVDGPGSSVTQSPASTLTIGGPSGTTASLNLINGGSWTSSTGSLSVHATGSVNIDGGVLTSNHINVNGGTLTKTSGTLVSSLAINNGGEVYITGSHAFSTTTINDSSLSVTGTASFLPGSHTSINGSQLTLGGLAISQIILSIGNSVLDVTGDISVIPLAEFEFASLTINQTGNSSITLGDNSAPGSSQALMISFGNSTITSGSGGINIHKGGGVYLTQTGETIYLNGPLLVEHEGYFAADVLNLAAVAPLNVRTGGGLQTPNLSLAAGNDLTVSGTSSRAYVSNLSVGASTGDVGITLSDNARLQDVSLLRVTPAGTTGSGTHRVDVLSGADVTNLGNVELGNNPAGTFDAEFNVDGPGSSVTQSAASTLTIGGNSGTTATLNLTNGGVWITGTAGITVNPTGQITGDGNIVGNVQNGGLVSPGTSPGALHIDGDYVQTASGELFIELASLETFDRLVVTNTLDLGGTLDVSLLEDYAPAAGATFDILEWATLIGTFDDVNLPALDGGLMWDDSNLYTTGVLAVVAPGLPGDFNDDNIVDAADYVVWRKGLGTTYTQDDLNVWRANFGNTAGSGGSSALPGVPEPTTLSLLLLTVVCCAFARRKSR
jgi:hypothetical protein